MCNRCSDTGERLLTEEELEAADLNGYDPESFIAPPTACYCECEIGQAKAKAFHDRFDPLIKAELDRMAGRARA